MKPDTIISKHIAMKKILYKNNSRLRQQSNKLSEIKKEHHKGLNFLLNRNITRVPHCNIKSEILDRDITRSNRPKINSYGLDKNKLNHHVIFSIFNQSVISFRGLRVIQKNKQHRIDCPMN